MCSLTYIQCLYAQTFPCSHMFIHNWNTCTNKTLIATINFIHSLGHLLCVCFTLIYKAVNVSKPVNARWWVVTAALYVVFHLTTWHQDHSSHAHNLNSILFFVALCHEKVGEWRWASPHFEVHDRICFLFSYLFSPFKISFPVISEAFTLPTTDSKLQ